MNKIRFRVLPYGSTHFMLVDQDGCQWANGHPFGFIVDITQYPSVYFKTETEAWSNVPKSGWDILSPETPLFKIILYEDPQGHYDSGMRYYYSQSEPNFLTQPVIIECLKSKVIIPDLKRYKRIEVTCV